MTSNNALIPDPDKEDILASKPLDWPFLHLGLRMCGWGSEQYKYYLMGTPLIWWGSTISLFVAGATIVVYLLRAQRKYVDMEPRKFLYFFCERYNLRQNFIGEWDHFLYVCKIAGAGWFFHFGTFPDKRRRFLLMFFSPVVPFLVMGRVTYLHHYVSGTFIFIRFLLSALHSCPHSILLSSCLLIFSTTLSSPQGASQSNQNG